MQRPLGDPVDFRPATPPGARVLEGGSVRLEPLRADRHARALHEADTDPATWDYLPYGPFADAAARAVWVREREGSRDPLFFAVVDAADDAARGVVSYLRMAPEHGSVEIGHVWFSPALQRTRQATEAIFLLARHAFDDLGFRRLEWKCDALNAGSRAAAERFGFTYEGTFRRHLVVKGRNRDTAWFSMVGEEWPEVRAAFERWLDPTNFTADGEQRAPLRARRTAARPSTAPATTPPC